MADPILSYRIPLTELDHPLGTWAHTGDHLVWHGRFPLDHPPLEVWEWRDGEVIGLPLKPNAFNLIPGGVPHHIEHLFGFWRSSEADTMWLRSVQADGAYYVMILGGEEGPDLPTRTGWYCPSCGRDLAHHDYRPTSGATADTYWRTQLAHVRAFNADMSLRTCQDCGGVHPDAFGFFAEDDNPIEADARTRGWRR